MDPAGFGSAKFTGLTEKGTIRAIHRHLGKVQKGGATRPPSNPLPYIFDSQECAFSEAWYLQIA